MSLSREDCVEVCAIRELVGRDCINCVYYNEKICEKLKRDYEVEKPSKLEFYYDKDKKKKIRRK